MTPTMQRVQLRLNLEAAAKKAKDEDKKKSKKKKGSDDEDEKEGAAPAKDVTLSLIEKVAGVTQQIHNLKHPFYNMALVLKKDVPSTRQEILKGLKELGWVVEGKVATYKDYLNHSQFQLDMVFRDDDTDPDAEGGEPKTAYTQLVYLSAIKMILLA